MSTTLNPEDFAKIFGVPADQIPADVLGAIQSTDFSYQRFDQAERDQIVLGILKKIDSKSFQIVGEHRREVWEKGWQENLDEFTKQNYSIEGLIPRFVRPNQIVRLRQEYVHPVNPTFELDLFNIYRLWLYRRYFADAQSVFEFGCGSGYNLTALAKLYPEASLCGLDWVESSVNLLNLIGKTHNLRITGRKFDFFNPDYKLEMRPGSVVLTMCALEQVGNKHDKFLEFLLQKSPDLCVNMEPLYELYDESNLADYLAMRYHGGRGYLNGYLTRLRQLEEEKKIEILQVQRPHFGSIYHEGYSFVAWRPLRYGTRT